jgi:protein CpxP
MKPLFKPLVLAGLLAGFGGLVTAQVQTPPAPPAGVTAPAPGMRGDHGPRGERHRFDPARMQERLAQRQAALKQKLQITAAQESAWTTWTSAMKPPAGFQRPDRAEIAKLTTPERIDRMRAIRAERVALSDKRGEATKTFYAALSPEQKKVFDDETVRKGRHGHRGHRGGPRS